MTKISSDHKPDNNLIVGMDITGHQPGVSYLPTGELKPAKRNARVHSRAQIEKLAASLKRFGFAGTIVIDEAGIVIGGNALLEAAKLMGMTHVPVMRLGDMTDADKRALALTLNRLGELSKWDDAILKAELEFLVECDFDVSDIGFDTADLDAIFAGDDDDGEDPVMPPSARVPVVSRLGDRWQIADQVLLCGDARDPGCYEQLLAGEKAQMIFADLPYNCIIEGNVSGLGAKTHREFVMASGEMSPAEFTDFLRQIFTQLVEFSTSGSIHYQFMDWRHMREIQDAAENTYTELKNMIVWAKLNAGMGTFYRSQHELIFVFKSGVAAHVNNFGLGGKGRHRSNVWSYAGATSFSKTRAEDLADHPTVKPVALVADAIKDCSDRGRIILDPCCGSGTTLLAAHRTGRRGAGMEIDPAYVDVAIRRLEKETGKDAVLSTGETFAQISALRAAPFDEAA